MWGQRGGPFTRGPRHHIRLPPVGPVRIRSTVRPFATCLTCVFAYRRFLAADGQNALGTKVSQKPKYSSSFLPCQSLLLTLRALRAGFEVSQGPDQGPVGGVAVGREDAIIRYSTLR